MLAPEKGDIIFSNASDQNSTDYIVIVYVHVLCPLYFAVFVRYPFLAIRYYY